MERGDWVFVVEGEKDADALAAIGLAAITNPGGTGKWRVGYGEALRGARVAIVPDHDAAGGAHAELVADALRGVASELRILELAGLPAKGDASDWIGLRRHQGRASAEIASELLALAAAAPTWEERVSAAGRSAVRSVRMSEVRPEAVTFLWRPYLPLGGAPPTVLSVPPTRIST